tara:strand:- start:103611 stop:105479 length:1869 start_codon:yes stop_codon:yes gene_type:complete
VRLFLLILCLFLADGPTALAADLFGAEIKPFLEKYCIDCHSGGEEANGDVDLSTMTASNFAERFEHWESAISRVKSHEMPPEDSPQPTEEERQELLKWYQAEVDSVDAHPGFFTPRRLCATEYRKTLRSLFGFDLEVAIIEAEQTIAEKSLVMKLLQTDPPGKSGFRNDTHGNPLTTILWDQYSYLADVGLEELLSQKRRAVLEKITGPIPQTGIQIEHADKLIRSFVPRAFRRSVPESKLAEIISAVKQSRDLEAALKIELKAVLMSAGFMFRGLMMEGEAGEQLPVDSFELAERLSYFIWGDMPDAELLDLASVGTLGESDVFAAQIERMIDSPKSINLADDFAKQWLTLDQIAKQSDNPPQAEALRSQPIDYMYHLIVDDRPLLELIDSKTAFANPFTAKFYGTDSKQMVPYRKQKGIEVEIVPNQKISLVATKTRGGILTMPGILEMNRGPVIRGTWILERILGEELPEPPADVGQIPANPPGKKLSFRERFEMHRSKATCAICHDRIDPLGFALQRYDGPDYKQNAEVDTTGKLPTGESFEDFAGLKQILVTTQREPVIRNIVERTLSYALCRKLEIFDRPTVDKIVSELVATDGTYRDLVHQVAMSLPFQQTVIRN